MDILLSGEFIHLHFLMYFTSLLLLECIMQKRGNVTSHNIQEYSKCLFQKAASFSEASLVVLVVHNRPANIGDAREAVLIPGLEDPLEKEMASHSSILAWKIPWTEEPGRLQSMGSQGVRQNLVIK